MKFNPPTKRLAIAVAIVGVAAVCLITLWAKRTSHAPPDILKEVISLQGTCSEDHANRKDTYVGSIVRWQTVATGRIRTYGYVALPFSAERATDEASHPTVYHPPNSISFDQIDIDTNQPNWQLHGVSVHGENGEGLNSTCELVVTKRGMDIPDAAP